MNCPLPVTTWPEKCSAKREKGKENIRMTKGVGFKSEGTGWHLPGVRHWRKFYCPRFKKQIVKVACTPWPWEYPFYWWEHLHCWRHFKKQRDGVYARSSTYAQKSRPSSQVSHKSSTFSEGLAGESQAYVFMKNELTIGLLLENLSWKHCQIFEHHKAQEKIWIIQNDSVYGHKVQKERKKWTTPAFNEYWPCRRPDLNPLA